MWCQRWNFPQWINKNSIFSEPSLPVITFAFAEWKNPVRYWKANNNGSGCIIFLREEDTEEFLGDRQWLSQGHGKNVLAIKAQDRYINSEQFPFHLQQARLPYVLSALTVSLVAYAIDTAHNYHGLNSGVQPAHEQVCSLDLG